MQHRIPFATRLVFSVTTFLIGSMVVASGAIAQRAPEDPTIVFSSSQPEGDLWLMDPDSANLRPLIDLRLKADEQPLGVRWSPDGQRVAFHTKLDGNIDIYVVNADGEKLKRLTNHEAEDSWPTWHPSGQRLAFTTNRDGNYEIYTLTANGNVGVNLTNDAAPDRQPDWSADGRMIAFASKRGRTISDVYTMDASGENPLNLTNHRGDDSYPRWSPNSQKIVWTSRRNGTGDLHTMDANGENVKNLTPGPRCNFDPAWSPDGTMLVLSDAPFVEIAVMESDKVVDDVRADGKVLPLGAEWQGSRSPDWFDPDFVVPYAVSPGKKRPLTWSWIKQLGTGIYRPE
ncbi:MAG: hypothetical protein OXP71_06335 [Candidatus Poribacteria bacterium]|nr:hypothetical protein [Candidatus Poribacteria bacterium]